MPPDASAVRPSGRRARSIGQRLTVASAALVAGAGLLVLGLVYLVTAGAMRRDVDESVDGEMSTLLQYHEVMGTATLESEVRARSRRGAYEYLLVNELAETVAGSLDAWPDTLDGPIDGVSLPVEDVQGDSVHVRWLRGSVRILPDGRRLLVARDISDQMSYEETLKIAVLGAGVLAVVVALAAGLTMSRNLLGRVEGMNRTILSILAGRPTDRVPQGGRDDEFEELARHFNTLLDRNDKLIAQVREVTNNIAHDLRSPLARMRGDLESALSHPRSREEYEDTLHHLMEETDSILETFSALLSIAQIESGASREHLERVDIAPIVQDVVELYEPVAEEAGLSLAARLDQVPVVRGNRRLIAQALTNLIDNAIKYGRDTVDVSVRWTPHGVELTVADRGPGIPPGSERKVLDRFVRLDASRNKPGTGLGLSFVSAVADLHGAELALGDNRPGLTVTLCFPPQAAAAGGVTAAGAGAREPEPAGAPA